MAYADLRDFLRALDKAGELRHVKAPVDPYLEVTEIVTRVIKDHGPALVFDNPVGSSYPIVINVFGTMRRMEMALGVDSLDDIGNRIGELIKPELPHGFAGIKDALGKVASLRGVPPKSVKSGPCRVGTTQLWMLLDRITQGDATMDDLAQLERLGGMVQRTSLCGLGQGAPNPIFSTLRYFRDEYLAHIVDRVCPAGVCKIERAAVLA